MILYIHAPVKLYEMMFSALMNMFSLIFLAENAKKTVTARPKVVPLDSTLKVVDHYAADTGLFYNNAV